MSEFYLDLNQVDYVVYHDGCMDGLTAAVAFKKWDDHTRKSRKPCMVFIPMKAGDLPYMLKELNDAVIVFLDCSPPTMDAYLDLKEKKNHVFIIDHHSSAKSLFGHLEGKDILIDETHSAAALAWKLLDETVLRADMDIVRFVLLVEDYDIQANRLLPDSKYLATALQTELNKVDEKLYNKLHIHEQLMNQTGVLIEKGKQMEEEIKFYVHSIVEKGQRIFFPIGEISYCFYFMDAESWNHSTDIGRAALELEGVTASILQYPGKTTSGKDVTKMSLRSNKIDVSKLAKLINNGGGHKQAAGCDQPDGYTFIDVYAALVKYFEAENAEKKN